MAQELTMGVVQQWISLTTGAFNVRQMWAELNIITTEDKAKLRVYLNRLVASGIIAKTAIDGTYRRIESEKIPINWEIADPNANIPIQLPFGLHSLCKVYPKSIIIVAGSKNEGKTAFLMECIKLNYERFIIDFYNSETGAEQLKDRFQALEIPTPAPFATWERYDNYGDIVEPTHMSIIDYLHLDSEFYLVGKEINDIFRKKTTGCAIIGIQKPPPAVTYVKGVKKIIERDMGYGGGTTALRASLYVSMSNHRLKIVYCKKPMNPKITPDGMVWTYDFDDNGFFTNIQRYYGDNNEQY